jgi:hypothetical protein
VRKALAIVAFCCVPLLIAFALLNLATDPKREPFVWFVMRNVGFTAGLVILFVIVGACLWRKPSAA